MKEKATIEDRIKKVISEVVDIKPESIINSSGPGSAENWDSLSHVEIILALEKEFNLTFTQEEAESMVNYRVIKAMINSQYEEK